MISVGESKLAFKRVFVELPQGSQVCYCTLDLSSPHQISLQHVALLTRPAVMVGTNVPHPLPITAFSIKGSKAVNMLQDSHKWVAVENGCCDCWRNGRVTFRWRLIGLHSSDVIIRIFFPGLWPVLLSSLCNIYHKWKRTEKNHSPFSSDPELWLSRDSYSLGLKKVHEACKWTELLVICRSTVPTNYTP